LNFFFREHYESQTQKNKQIELKKKLESEKEALQGGHDDGISTRRLRNRDADKRKEALSNLKQMKQTGASKGTSILQNRCGVDGLDDLEGETGRDLAERRRRRKELQHTRGGDDDDAEEKSKSSKKSSATKLDEDEVELEDVDITGPLELKHALAVSIIVYWSQYYYIWVSSMSCIPVSSKTPRIFRKILF